MGRKKKKWDACWKRDVLISGTRKERGKPREKKRAKTNVLSTGSNTLF